MNNSYPKSWSRIMTQTISELNKKKNLTRLDLKRGALALVKGLNVRNKKINAESEADYIKAVWDNFQLYEMTLTVIGMLTPQEVIETFPIYKRYDGHKYETKDYFSVQNSLAAYDLNQPINAVDDKAFEFLWDYDNDDLVEFAVDFMGAMSHINRLEKGNVDKQNEIQAKIDEINAKIAEGNQKVADKQKELDAANQTISQLNQQLNDLRQQSSQSNDQALREVQDTRSKSDQAVKDAQ